MTPNFIVRRVSRIPAGAFGVMLHDGAPFAVTLERTYEGERIKIPAGVYLCKRDFYHRGGYPTYEIPLAGHDRLLLHKANVETELDGCIALAEQYSMFGAVPGVGNSKGGFDEFMQRAANAPVIRLQVEDRYA